MSERIQRHQSQRPSHWGLIEEPLQLADAISSITPPQCVLVDCLTLWVSNWLMEENPAGFQHAKEALLTVLQQSPHHIILVSNETGMGVIPMGKLSRTFVDESGWLHQAIAAIADEVVLTVAGLPLPLKQQGKNCFASHLTGTP